MELTEDLQGYVSSTSFLTSPKMMSMWSCVFQLNSTKCFKGKGLHIFKRDPYLGPGN